MEIKTKYNKGDKVYFIYENKPSVGIITSICAHNDVMYTIDDCIILNESKLYETKQKMIDEIFVMEFTRFHSNERGIPSEVTCYNSNCLK